MAARSPLHCEHGDCRNNGEAGWCSRSRTARLRSQRIRAGHSGAADGRGERSAKWRRATAAGKKLPRAAGARPGDQKRGEGRDDRSAEFDLPRMARESVRREGGSRELVLRNFACEENAQGVRDGGTARREKLFGAASADRIR